MHVFTCVWALHVFTSLGLPYFSVYTGSYLDEQPKTKWLWIQAHTQTHHTFLASTLPMCAFVPALLRCPVLSVKPVWLRGKQTLRWTSSVDNVHSKRSNLPWLCQSSRRFFVVTTVTIVSPERHVICCCFIKTLHDLLWKVGGTNQGRKSPSSHCSGYHVVAVNAASAYHVGGGNQWNLSGWMGNSL